MMGTRSTHVFTLFVGLVALSGCKKEAIPGEPGDYLGRCLVPAFTGDSMVCYEVRDGGTNEADASAACANLYGSGDVGTWTGVDPDADKYFDGCPKPDLFGDTDYRLYGRCDGFIYQDRDGDKAFYSHSYYYGPFDESGNSQEWGCDTFEGAVYYPAMEMPGDLPY